MSDWPIFGKKRKEKVQVYRTEHLASMNGSSVWDDLRVATRIHRWVTQTYRACVNTKLHCVEMQTNSEKKLNLQSCIHNRLINDTQFHHKSVYENNNIVTVYLKLCMVTHHYFVLTCTSTSCSECCWRTSTEKNTCGIARFPCGSTAFLFTIHITI